MLAVDFNVVVRHLPRDEAEQFAKASALIRGENAIAQLILRVYTRHYALRVTRSRRGRGAAA
jgi:hypothetical protein